MPVGFLSRGRRALALGSALCLALSLALSTALGSVAAAAAATSIGGSGGGDDRGDGRTLELEDDLGHHCVMSAYPQRIISLSPSLTEMLFAIGCDSTRIVGVTTFCDYPPAAMRIAKVGGIVDASLEAMLLLRPDLVLATRGNPLELIESLMQLGIPVYAMEDRGDLARVFTNIRRLGEVTGRDAEANALADSLQSRLDAVSRATATLAPQQRPRVYFGELGDVLWTAGPGSHVDGVISAAGGANVAADAPDAWCPLALEAVLARDPEVYFGSYAGIPASAIPRDPVAAGAARTERLLAAQTRARDYLRGHAAWRTTSLGREPRIFLVEEDRILRPGPRVIDVLEEFARFLHPELFAAAGD